MTCSWCLRHYGSEYDHPLRMAGVRTMVGQGRRLNRALRVFSRRCLLALPRYG